MVYVPLVVPVVVPVVADLVVDVPPAPVAVDAPPAPVAADPRPEVAVSSPPHAAGKTTGRTNRPNQNAMRMLIRVACKRRATSAIDTRSRPAAEVAEADNADREVSRSGIRPRAAFLPSAPSVVDHLAMPAYVAAPARCRLAPANRPSALQLALESPTLGTSRRQFSR